MPDLNFQVEGAEAVAFAAAPLLAFKLRISNADAEERIQTVALRCQIQIEVARRHYEAQEKERLLDLFGEPERWSQTLRSMRTAPKATGKPSMIGCHEPCVKM